MKQFISKLISIFKKPQTKKSKKAKVDPKKEKLIKAATIAAAVLLLLGIPVYLFIRDPSAILVAKVNKTYITRAELNKALIKSSGQQVLEDLAYKKLAESEFKKNNIVVSEEELNSKIVEIEQSLGGMSLEEALSSSGMTMEDLRSNILLQVSIEKLLSDKIVITQEQITEFITLRAEELVDMTDEQKNEYAQEQLKQQNLQNEMGKWFEEIKQSSDVKFYL